MPEPKDVIVGILGASGALAGLLLVFSGFVFAQAASFPEETDDKVIEKYRTAGRLAIYPFWGFLVTTLLSLAWMLHPHSCVYLICIVLFFILVLGTGIYGTLAAYRYL
jgi:hypothetical protein